MQQLVKLLKAIDLLSKPGGTTKKELAETLEVSERQVYRIIMNIEDLGFPIYDDEDAAEKEKRWKLMDTFVKKLPNITIPDLQLSIAEIISLYLIKGEEKLYRGTDIEKTINSAFQKIGMFLPEEAADQLKKIKTLFVPAAKFAKDYSGKEEVINQLTEAILQRKTCLVTYHSFSEDKVKDFSINPLHFYEREGGLYIFVQSAAYGDVITLAVERIKRLTITPDSFEYPKSFDPEAMLDSTFDFFYEEPSDFKIWFSADQARYIKEREWSKTQKIEDQEDGSIILTMRTGGTWAVKRWVLSNGAQAKVLEPESLKQEMMEELKTAYERYE